MSLTTTGTSGPATYDGLTGELNIPEYTLGGFSLADHYIHELGNVTTDGSPITGQVLT